MDNSVGLHVVLVENKTGKKMRGCMVLGRALPGRDPSLPDNDVYNKPNGWVGKYRTLHHVAHPIESICIFEETIYLKDNKMQPSCWLSNIECPIQRATVSDAIARGRWVEVCGPCH